MTVTGLVAAKQPARGAGGGQTASSGAKNLTQPWSRQCPFHRCCLNMLDFDCSVSLLSIADDSKLNNPVKNIPQFLDASIGSRSGVCQMMLSSDGFPEDDMSHLAIAEDATSPESQVRSEAFARASADHLCPGRACSLDCSRVNSATVESWLAHAPTILPSCCSLSSTNNIKDVTACVFGFGVSIAT